MSEHTPGPWHVSDSNEILDERSFLVAAEIMGERPEIYRANARLIAAAPEMLAICKRAQGVLERWPHSALAEDLVAIIHRAEGCDV